jgi:hypothetical protein
MHALRTTLVTALLLAVGSLQAAEKQPCKDDARVIEQCFAVHGRLTVHANLRPYLWPAGTNRLLGIADPDGTSIMPPELDAAFASDPKLAAFGDFEVCPYTREVPGRLRLVCIASVSRLVVREGKR